MSEILIRGGRVLDPGSEFDGLADVWIRGGRIEAVVSPGTIPAGAAPNVPVLEAAGLLVCPGFVDLHVSLREPGYEEDECVLTGTAAALAGGFTSICAQSDSSPVVDNRSAAEFVRLQAERAQQCRVFPLGAVTKQHKGEELAEIGQLVQGGAVGFSDAMHPVANAEVMRRALEYTRMFRRPVLHFAMVPELAEQGVMHEGFQSTRLGLRGIPAAAQDIMTGRDIALAELTGGRVHLMCVSTRDSVSRIRQARASGIAITCDVSPHHLLLTDELMDRFDPIYKCNPPLRSREHVDALISGLRDGTISAISADHQPRAQEKKQVELDQAPFGICGLETALSVCVQALIRPGHLTWLQLITRLTKGPADVMGLPCGTLTAGQAADITLVDPQSDWTVDAGRFASRSRNTPFHGQNLPAVVKAVLVDGVVRYSR